jgi:predicted lysophospholipase L1 biosynthesis ABC-type transport system permease subunit
VLLLAVFFIFGIAMVIINNAMMMATLQRTQMIGTMRAIGAQRRLILTMVLAESVVLGRAVRRRRHGLGSAVMSAAAQYWHRRAQRRGLLLLLGARSCCPS